MKTIDKKLLFVSSDERDSGYTSDFHLSLPPHLLTCRQNHILVRCGDPRKIYCTVVLGEIYDSTTTTLATCSSS